MDLTNFIYKNALLAYETIDESVLEKIIEQEADNNKYGFNFLFRTAPIDNNIDFQKKYAFAIDTITKINNITEMNYTEDEIKIISAYFVFRTIEWEIRDTAKESISFVESILKLTPLNEIVQWIYEELQFIAVQLYSQDIENYKNGTIGKLIDILEPKIDNHTTNLILE